MTLSKALRKLIWFIPALLIVAPAPGAACQAAPTPPATSSLAGPDRSPEAIELLRSAIRTLGGEQFWSQVHAALVTGTISEDAKEDGAAIAWTDEWSSDARMKREISASKDFHAVRYAQDHMSTTSTSSESPTAGPKPTFRKPRFDKATTLLMHLPAAALYAVVDDASYSVSEVAGSSEFGSACARVRKETRASTVDATICFSSTTKLPTHATIALRNALIPNRTLTESVEYTDFYRVDSVLLPHTVTVIDPGKNKKYLTFGTAVWNPSLPTDAFSAVQK